jgi:anti-sigma B factor antagonist
MRTSRTPNDHDSFSVSETRLAGGVVVLAVSGELDVATVPTLRERVNAITEGRVVLDLREVSFLDSTALAVFVHAKLRLDGRLTLVLEADSYARLIFEVAGLADVLDVVETLDEVR